MRAPTACQKQQSMIEFIVTYSWALLILAMFVAVVFALTSTQPPSSYLPSTCSINPAFQCTAAGLYQSGPSSAIATVSFINELGTPVEFGSGSFNVSIGALGPRNITAIGHCSPSMAQQNARVNCSAQLQGFSPPSVGTSVDTFFSISYRICTGNRSASCGTQLYTTSGFASQSVSSGP